MRNMSSTQSSSSSLQMDPPGLSPKKTVFVMVTVVGCIAILWPKVFYPMMFGGQIKQNLKDHRGGTAYNLKSSTCCEVVLDKDTFFNASLGLGIPSYRKQLNLLTGEISLRQERPMHLRPDTIHPAMRERGRAIPATPTVPIVERSRIPSSPPRIVEGRPGPIPGMRPPLGAGSVHQAQPKSSNMGFIMPLYTIGIVAFFIYTIMKILFKKPISNAPYGSTSRADPNFHKEVFGHDKSCCKSKFDECSGNNDGGGGAVVGGSNKLGLLDAADEQLKLRETNSSNSTANNNLNKNTSVENVSNGHAKSFHQTPSNNGLLHKTSDDAKNHEFDTDDDVNINTDGDIDKKHSSSTIRNHKKISKLDKNHDANDNTENDNKNLHQQNNNETHKDIAADDDHLERSVVVLGMELTASCEGGQKWNRPPTPVFPQHIEHSTVDDDKPEPQPIYLEGALPHESQILVADSKTQAENLIDEELNGTFDEPAVVLSSKMTLSLINLSNTDITDENLNNNNNNNNKNESNSNLEDNNNYQSHHHHHRQHHHHHHQQENHDSENEEKS